MTVPPWFKTDHISILNLGTLILTVFLAYQLFAAKGKSKPRLLLATLYSCASIYNLFFYLNRGFTVYAWQYTNWQGPLQLVGLTSAVVLLLQFVYCFPRLQSGHRTEARVVLAITALLAVALLSCNVLEYVFGRISKETYRVTEASVLGSQFLWMAVVVIRKTIALSKNQSTGLVAVLIRPEGEDARAARALFMLVLFAIGAVIAALLGSLLKLPGMVVQWFCILMFYSVLFMTYLNQTADRTTFRMKLLAVILITNVCMLCVAAYVFGRSFEDQYENVALINQNQTIRFTPNEHGSYDIERVPLRFDYELGQNLAVTVAPKEVELQFDFPFFDGVWQELSVLGTSASIYLGDLGQWTPRWGRRKASAAITALSARLDFTAGPGVFFKGDIEKATITWYKLPTLHGSLLNTIQVELRRDGTLELRFKDINPSPTYRIGSTSSTANLVGIHPGGRHSRLEPIRFATGLPYSSKTRAVIFEDYRSDFIQALSHAMAPMAIILIAACLFAVFLFPVIFRSGLIRPLQNLYNGLTEVDAGDLDVHVKPQFNDEVGSITEAFNRMVQSVKRADRLKDEFLANTSHELRTPLHGIIGIAESLIDGAAGDLSALVKRNLSMVVTGGKRLSNLVNDILDFSKLKEGGIALQRHPVDLRGLTEVVIRLLKPLVGSKSLELRNEIPRELPQAWGDPDRLQQIMYNLVGNAVKFTDSGSVTVTAELASDDLIDIRVTDTGIGIPEDRLDDVFKSFQQADASSSRDYGGTGLGLSITKQLVGLHGGDVSLQSQVGIGSTFKVTIPVCLEQEAAESELPEVAKVRLDAAAEDESPVVSKTTTDGLRILVVDDEPINLQVLANHLSLERYQVIQARNGPEALAICEESLPDLILLDIMMPRMNGYEVCQRLRESHAASKLPVIMLTAKNQVSDLVEGLSVGANDYVAKPFSRQELIARIRTHLELAKINIATSHFVPHKFLEILGKKSIIDVRLGDQVPGEMTVMFADIRSFTSLSEKMTPSDTFEFINSYLKRLVPVIRNHDGIIDKYIGDEIMALFPQDAGNALESAIEMQRAVSEFNTTLVDASKEPIRIGIGMHTGGLILGIIGEEQRMEETVISDAVNLASRVEGLTKLYATPVLLSQATYAQLAHRDDFTFRFIGMVTVKGKTQPTTVYELLEGNDEQSRKLKMATKEEFERGLGLYYERDFTGAAVCFNNVLKENSADKAAVLYRERSASYTIAAPPKEWDGAEVLDTK